MAEADNKTGNVYGSVCEDIDPMVKSLPHNSCCQESQKIIAILVYLCYTMYRIITVMRYSLVWAKALWTTVGGKNFPPFFLYVG